MQAVQEVKAPAESASEPTNEFLPAETQIKIAKIIGGLRCDLLTRDYKRERGYEILEDPSLKSLGFTRISEWWCDGSRKTNFDTEGNLVSIHLEDYRLGIRLSMLKDTGAAERIRPDSQIHVTTNITIGDLHLAPKLLVVDSAFVRDATAKGMYTPGSPLEERLVFDSSGSLVQRVVAISENVISMRSIIAVGLMLERPEGTSERGKKPHIMKWFGEVPHTKLHLFFNNLTK